MIRASYKGLAPEKPTVNSVFNIVLLSMLGPFVSYVPTLFIILRFIILRFIVFFAVLIIVTFLFFVLWLGFRFSYYVALFLLFLSLILCCGRRGSG